MRPPRPPAPCLPEYWSPQQALAAWQCLHAMRQALWALYGPQIQQAWRDQLLADDPPPDFDPDSPF